MSAITRRRALGAAAAAAAGLAAGRALTAPAPAQAAAPAHAGHHPAQHGPAPFDEVYQGRRIQGEPVHGGGHHDGHGGYAVHVDGEELHVMRNADGTWISVINHYEPLADPRAVARAAVRELNGADLVPLDLG
ncbi:apotyrosinase chaperone MelC1 [Streptomyces sp. ODS05-4]|uniref:apotyrosinase chaperone MelC1 n=1 Tax=Streptomyces sp. ODS05-4 TaxID=2944939 RepID=UPI00210A42EE|nr:tyrosinase cofactor [Streptomyces sp. ODS05-4]